MNIEARFKNVADFDLDFVARKHAAEHGVDLTLVRSWMPELKRWLVLCAANRAVDYRLYGHIDDLWHTFILFTREYADFCAILGTDFIHHVPEVPTEEMVLACGSEGHRAKGSVEVLSGGCGRNATSGGCGRNAIGGGCGRNAPVQASDPPPQSQTFARKKVNVERYAQLLEDYREAFPGVTPNPALWPDVTAVDLDASVSGGCGGPPP